MKSINYLLMGMLLFSATLGFSQTNSEFSIQEFPNLSYVEGGDSLQQLNLLIPQKESPVPLFIWIGGGAWSFVDRHMEMDFARQMCKRGIAVASVGHRLSAAVWKDPQKNTGVKHPTHIEDLAQAFVWLYEQAETYGYSQNAIFIGGFSSGAHLAALLTMDASYLNELGSSPENIKGVIPIGGAFDIAHYREYLLNSAQPNLATEHVDAVFGNTEEAHAHASPSTYLDQLNTPMLLISDNSLYAYTKVFEEQLKEAEYTDCDILHISRYGHGALWKHLSFDENSEYREIMVNFIKKRALEDS